MKTSHILLPCNLDNGDVELIELRKGKTGNIKFKIFERDRTDEVLIQGEFTTKGEIKLKEFLMNN